MTNNLQSDRIPETNPNQSRIENWKQKLLDLSRRNRLLNFKDNRLAIPIDFSQPAILEDEIAASKTFKILLAKKRLEEENLPTIPDQSKSGTYSITNDLPVLIENKTEFSEANDPGIPLGVGNDSIQKLAIVNSQLDFEYQLQEFKRSRLHATKEITEKVLEKRLKDIYRQAQNDMLEGGVNTLFLSLGMLEWTEKDAVYKAPLLLVPMKMTRKTAAEGYAISRYDEDTIVNVTLLEMMKQDFGLTLPDLDPLNLPTDDSGVDVPKIFQMFEQEIQNMSGWKIHNDVWLGIFSFQKFIMWKDMNNRMEELDKNIVFNHLVHHSKEFFDDKFEIVNAQDIDKRPYNELLVPLGADSSQYSAVLTAEQGKTFVLYGPPGTGKSQTITNIIAHCLGKGKRVLFVAEKRAALEVVYKRLCNIGLQPFCLELHSNKSGKQETLEQFRDALEFNENYSMTDWNKTVKDLELLRQRSNEYVEAIHHKYPCGLSVYNAFSWLMANQDSDPITDKIAPFNVGSVTSLTAEKYNAYLEAGKNLTVTGRSVPAELFSRFAFIRSCERSQEWTLNVRQTAEKLKTQTAQFKQSLTDIVNVLGMNQTPQKHSDVKLLNNLQLFFENNESNTVNRIPQNFYSQTWGMFSKQATTYIQSGRCRDNMALFLKRGRLEQIIQYAQKSSAERVACSNESWLSFTTLPEKVFEDLSQFQNGEQLQNAYRILKEKYNQLLPLAQNLYAALDIKSVPQTDLQFALLSEIIRLLTSFEPTDRPVLDKNWTEFSVFVRQKLVPACRLIRTLKSELSAFDLSRVLRYDFKPILQEIKEIPTRFFLFQWINKWSLIRNIRQLLKDPTFNFTYNELPSIVENLVHYKEAYRIIRSVVNMYPVQIGSDWDCNNPNISPVEQLVEQGDAMVQRLTAMVESCPTFIGSALKQLGKYWYKQTRVTSPEFYTNADRFQKALSEFQQSFTQFLTNLSAGLTLKGNINVTVEPVQDVRSMNIDNTATAPMKFSDFLSAIENLIIADVELLHQSENIAVKVAADKCSQAGVSKWDSFQQTIDSVNQLDALIVQLSGNETYLDSVRSKVGQMLSMDSNSPDRNMYKERLHVVNQKAVEFSSALDNLFTLCQTPQNVLDQEDSSRLDHCTTMADAILNNSSQLRNWSFWNQACADMKAIGLENVAIAVVDGTLPLEMVQTAIEKKLCNTFVEQATVSTPVLRDFLVSQQDALVEAFQKLDEKYRKMSSEVIISNLAKNLPNSRTESVSKTSEMGILKHELEKKKRHKPVRQLLELMPTLAPTLKPCMLMSPLSVAQYLPPDQSHFDLIIFDEASQIPVWDAIGVIARGKQLIVVGDPKQLPPTNFFQRQLIGESVDDSDTEDIEDLESILDECQAVDMSPIHLNWHYRSRHESLISFSNHFYYDDGLMTFPSASNSSNLGVHFEFVSDGQYESKGSRTNPMEAQALVDHLVNRLLDPKFKNKSFGVVTFNMAQQSLIEDLLEEKRQELPEIERFFDNDEMNSEPLFVKNLENVQGDERDIIYFSVCYGPDKNGKIAMNFGPVNRSGGERRLNVAFTRAKEQNVIFSSIHFTDIDLNRTSAVGASHLRSYLEYAQKGSAVINWSGEDKVRVARELRESCEDSLGFESAVKKVLESNGYTVVEQVGCSKYKIDLAIVSPDNPNEYVVGVECDGRNYCQCESFRDRDLLRRQVLEGLGWKLVRVWSTAWRYDPASAEKKLLEEVRKVYGVR